MRAGWIDGFLDDRPVAKDAKTEVAVFDEDRHWLAGNASVDHMLERMKLAGVQTYVPCVWDGHTAAAASSMLPMEARFAEALKAGSDPLAYLIMRAHALGIRVKLWFDVSRHVGPDALDRFAVGSPPNAFNVHDPEFRQFIARAISESYQHYDADGLNLDYIRSQGECSLVRCEEEYRSRSGRSLVDDHVEMISGRKIPELMLWNAEPISDLLAHVRSEVSGRQRSTEISVDTIPNDHERLHEGVDVQGWLRLGLVDRIYYMAYGDPFDVVSVDQASHELGCDRLSVLVQNYEDVGAEIVDYDGPLLDQILHLARASWPGCEIGLYHYPHLTDSQLQAISRATRANRP